MLFKLSIKNIQRSLRDYSIYFFTLVIGVMVFYAFNAMGSQTAMLQLTLERGRIASMVEGMLLGVSFFVAFVLGFLIVYASQFLMKRRNKEFAIYLLLGMSKREISRILFGETLLIGVGSLIIGLILGIGLSQFTSAFVAKLFVVDMSAYRFTISGEAIIKTVIFFFFIYVIVMLFNSSAVKYMKLINLLQSERKSETIKLKNPVLCWTVFIFASILLALDYYYVGWYSIDLNEVTLLGCIMIGSIATFLLFWSVSGILLRLVMSVKKVYHSGLNCFTFRQLSSKVNTVVLSMTIICLMLFFTICGLSSAFSIRNNMNANMDQCRADFEITHKEMFPSEIEGPQYDDILKRYASYGYNLSSNFESYVHFPTYYDANRSLESSINNGGQLMYLDDSLDIIKLSDYNNMLKLYHVDPIVMGDDEYVLVCNYEDNKKIFNKSLHKGLELNLYGHALKSKYNKVSDGYFHLASGRVITGLLVVPDYVIDENAKKNDIFIGNYYPGTDKQLEEIEKQVRIERNAIEGRMQADEESGKLQTGYYTRLTTKAETVDNSIGMGALMTILGLYLGMIFLITSGALLALRELSNSVDSIRRYDILRKIGAGEAEISKSLAVQTGIFFLLPLFFASIHSIFGMKCAASYLALVGTEGMAKSIAVTSLIILFIYGGYFLITYLGSYEIIAGRRSPDSRL